MGDEGLVFKAQHGRAKGISSTWMGKGLRCSQSGSGVTHMELEKERKTDSGVPESGPNKPSTVQPGAAKPEVCASLPL